jgi:hypothetical protein
MTQNTPLTTINDLFRRVAAAANPRAILWQDEFNHWQPISSDQIYQRVRALAQAFLSWGAQKGDRIALIAENRWEWAVTDFAALAIGAVDVPIYPTLTGEQIAVLVADAGCRIAVVSTRQQFDKLNAVRGKTALERILMMDPAAPESAIAFSEVLKGADERGAERDPVFDALARSDRAKGPGHADLHLRNHRRAQGRGAHPRQHGRQPELAAVDFDFSPDRRPDLLPASLARYGARAGLRDVLPRGAGGLLLALRQTAAGHARDSPHGFCRRAARLREDSPGGGAPRRLCRL